jgi:hypothetical protein
MPYQDRVRGTFSIKALATTHVRLGCQPYGWGLMAWWKIDVIPV